MRYICLTYIIYIHLLLYKKIGYNRYLYKLSIYNIYAPINKPFDYHNIFSFTLCRCLFNLGSYSYIRAYIWHIHRIFSAYGRLS